MTAALATASILSAAVIAASARLLWRVGRSEAATRPRAWRVALLLLAQAASAGLLYATLFPPMQGMEDEAATLVVATADADRVAGSARRAGDRLVALPEAPAIRGAERLPDLATALRRHPATTRIRVLGAGLVARDQTAARGHAVVFHPAPLPPGLVALRAPRRVQSGRQFDVAGQAHALPGGSAELLDPGGAIVDRAALGEQGHFKFTGAARSAGQNAWRLRLRAGDGSIAETALLPIVVAPGAPLRVVMLAGATNAELKYLRRWASDAGLRLETRISLGAGMDIGNTTIELDADGLNAFDLVVLDQRAWRSLGQSRRAALRGAVDDGLGLLLRLPGELSANDRARLQEIGFAPSTESTSRTARLPVTSMTERDDADGATGEPPALTRAPQHITASDGVALLRDAKGSPLAMWRARGAGRIGVATFDDSFRLVLAGHADAHGELWSTLLSTLARATAAPAPTIDAIAWQHRRVTLCEIRDDAEVQAPDDATLPLHVDPASGAGNCAGFWPRSAGWHVLRSGDTRTPFHVRAADDVPGLRAAAVRDATRQLAATQVSTTTPGAPQLAPTRGPRWPWFLAWLLLSAGLWWFERSRAGRGAISGQ